jgi:UDP-glucuronate 4-epimerase
MLSSRFAPRRGECGLAILITGLGYIGARLAADLLASGQRVVALENFFCTSRQSLRRLRAQPGLTLIEGSINQPASLRRAFGEQRVEAVVHLAAQPSAHSQAATPAYTERTNLGGARLTLEAALAAGVERVVLGSSFKVLGDELPPLVGERQPYGRVYDLAHLSKIYVEKLGEMLAATRGLSCLSVRLGITYGLGPVMKHDPRFMVVPNLFACRAAQGQPLTVHPSATRAAGFIHLEDASRALQAALSLPTDRPSYRPLNAVTECLTVGQVAEAVRGAGQARGVEVIVEGSADPAAPIVRVESSLAEALALPHKLADSIGEVIDHFRATPSSRRGSQSI